MPSLRTQRRLLWLMTAGLMLACGPILYFGLRSPLDLQTTTLISDPVQHNDPAITEPSTSSGASELPSLESLLTLAARDYRQRLFDPPPPPAVETPQLPLPEFSLVGTVLNPQRPVAMIADARGVITLKTIGDRIGDEENYAVIDSIESDHIRLDHAGQSVTVKKESSSPR